MKIPISFLIIFHLTIWLYILFGSFIGKIHSKIILFLIIPLIYLIHILPFHLINELKKNSLDLKTDDELKENISNYEEKLPIINNIIQLKHYADKEIFKNSFANPLSPQGLLILAYIISIYALFNFNFENISRY